MTTNPRQDTLPSFADLFESIMVHIWGGTELETQNNEYDLHHFYDSFHNAINTARAMGAQIIGGPIYDDDDDRETLLRVRFRDGSELMIHAHGGGIEPHGAKPQLANIGTDKFPQV